MVRKKEEVPYESKPAPFHGVGEITVRSLLNRGQESAIISTKMNLKHTIF